MKSMNFWLGSALHSAGMFLGKNWVGLRVKKQRANRNRGVCVRSHSHFGFSLAAEGKDSLTRSAQLLLSQTIWSIRYLEFGGSLKHVACTSGIIPIALCSNRRFSQFWQVKWAGKSPALLTGLTEWGFQVEYLLCCGFHAFPCFLAASSTLNQTLVKHGKTKWYLSLLLGEVPSLV